MSIIISGHYPQSEKLITAARQFERGKLTEDAYHEILKKDVLSFSGLQEGFLYQSSGLFNWLDPLRPFTELLNDVKAETLVRFEETNTFWRVLEKTAPLSWKSTDIHSWKKRYLEGDGALPSSNGRLVTFAFPTLFHSYSKGWSLDEIEQFYIELIKKLELNEHDALIFVDIPKKGKINADFFIEIKKNFKGKLFYRTLNASLELFLEDAHAWQVDGIGFEYSLENLDLLKKNWPKGKIPIAGIVKTANTKIPTTHELKNCVEEIKNSFPNSDVYLGVEGIAENLPRAVMDEKIVLLKEVIS